MVSIPECFSESYAEARAKFCSAAATAGGATPLVAQSARPGAERRAALPRHGALRAGRRRQHAGADLEHARRRGPLRLGRADRLAGDRRPGEAAEGHRRADRACDQSLRLRLDAPRQRGQRRPQPQLRRSRQGLSEERRLSRHRRRRPAPGVERGEQGRDRAHVRLLRPEARRLSPCRARSAAASTPIPTASSSAAPSRPGATAPSAPSRARSSAAPARVGDHRLPHRARTVRPWRADLRRAARPPSPSRAPRPGTATR